MKQILKVLIGSQAHGTARPDSDMDYRGVFVHPTSEILSIQGVKNQTNWIEGKIDDTSYEIQKFLMMASKCNPNIMEIFVAPVVESTELGEELRALLPYAWNKTDTLNAFRGYASNQRKKFFDRKDKKPEKYLQAWIRTLYQGEHLLATGEMIVDFKETPIFQDLLDIRSKEYSVENKLRLAFDLERKLEKTADNTPDKNTDMDKLNEFLLKVRGLN